MNLNEFISKVKELGIELNDNQINQFNKYYELLVEYNKVMNLTGITEYEEVLEKHFYDSLTMANKVNLSNSTLVDIGAGAGFPCIPLKIAFPSLDVTVVDSLAKRMKFLEIVIKELNLENIRCLAMRGEDFAKLHREEFDFVTARAVARLNILNEITLPLVKVGGYFIALKGQDGLIEIDECKDAFNKLGARIDMIDEFNLPSENAKRINIFIKKEKKTNVIYPRDYAKIKKSPLK
jgi:16S rRNA (guanine527-N7)-methyltransferase